MGLWRSAFRRLDVFGWFGTTRNILCIGATHLDTIATLEHGDSIAQKYTTKLGTIVHAVGGSAYSIATNLAREDTDRRFTISLFTILPKYSILTQVFYRKMREGGIDTSHVHQLATLAGKKVSGGGYVAVFDQRFHRTTTAVTDPALQDVNIFEAKESAKSAKKSVKAADSIVVTSGLSTPTIRQLMEKASSSSTPLFVSIGSAFEGKRNWLGAAPSAITNATCVCSRLEVFEALLKDRVSQTQIDALSGLVREHTDAKMLQVREICSALSAQHLIVTDFKLPEPLRKHPKAGTAGFPPDQDDEDDTPIARKQRRGRFAILSANGDVGSSCTFDASDAVDARLLEGNTAGLTDAALSGFIRFYQVAIANERKKPRADRTPLPQLNLEKEDTRKALQLHIDQLATKAAGSRGPTPGSLISLEEEQSKNTQWTQINRSIKTVLDYVFVPFIVKPAVAVIGSALIAYFLIHVVGICTQPLVARYFGKVCWLLN